MQWEMMSHFNEKHKEIEKPRCYFLSSVVLCVFFFSSCCCSNERKLGENYSITSSPSPSHTSTRLPLDSLNRHVLTRVDLCCKSCYWFLFFIFFSRWCSAVASCVPFLLHILSTDQCSMAALCYLLLQRTATDKRRKKKTCTKIVGRGNRKLRWCCFFFFFLLLHIIALKMLHYGLSFPVGSSVVATSEKNWREIRRGTCRVIFLGQRASKGIKK